jgi:non-ribosomal peptide synthetase component F
LYHDLIQGQVKRTPDAVAVQFEDQSLTYRELDQRADDLANVLIGHGVKPGILVGLFLNRSLEMVVGLLGVLKAGGAYLPLDPSFPSERLAFMLEDPAPGFCTNPICSLSSRRTRPDNLIDDLDHGLIKQTAQASERSCST